MENNRKKSSKRLLNVSIGLGRFVIFEAFIDHYQDLLVAAAISLILQYGDRHSNGGFFISNEDFKRKLAFKKDRTQRVLRELEADGLIVTKMVKIGDAPRRCVFVIEERLQQIYA